MTATTMAPSPATQWRNGITVFAREIIPGDHMMDRGKVREVASLSPTKGLDSNSLVNFEPLDEYPPTIWVPNKVQVYVRRICAGQNEAPPMPVIDHEARALFAQSAGRRRDPRDPLAVA